MYELYIFFNFFHFFFILNRCLKTSEPQFIDNTQNQIRKVILEIFNRLPNNEILSKYVNELCEVVMHTLSVDNEVNALICIRIIFDIQKAFSPKLESFVQPFINFMIKLYGSLNESSQGLFYESALAGIPEDMRTDMNKLKKGIEELRKEEIDLRNILNEKRNVETEKKLRYTTKTRLEYEYFLTSPTPQQNENDDDDIIRIAKSMTSFLFL